MRPQVLYNEMPYGEQVSSPSKEQHTLALLVAPAAVGTAGC
jgi:hypothetical protein